MSSVEQFGDRVLMLCGHAFVFAGEPGQVTSVQTEWAMPFDDDAVRLAHLVIEANLLAMYAAGVLFRDGKFSPEVVGAFETTFDQVGSLVDRLDDEQDEVADAEMQMNGPLKNLVER